MYGRSSALFVKKCGVEIHCIGIDFATHFTMRYREEIEANPDQMLAIFRTGVGTGTALAGSTVSSAAGFIILSFASMPMFASFGILTSMMIVFALKALLVGLPGLQLFADRRNWKSQSRDLFRSPGVNAPEFSADVS